MFGSLPGKPGGAGADVSVTASNDNGVVFGGKLRVGTLYIGPMKVSGLEVGSKASDRVYVNVDQLKRGTTLDFRLTADAAAATWGTSPSSAPVSPCSE